MKTKHLLINILLIGALLLAGCRSGARVGALQAESRSVEMDDAKEVSVEIHFGAGSLDLSGGAEKLLNSDFTYNVDKLKPEIQYTDSTLVVRQPPDKGMPDLRNIENFRNEWKLRLNDSVPMALFVDVGAGTSDLHLSGLSLTRLHVNQGAGTGMIDLSGDWARNLDATIETGATDITVRLPKDTGARVVVGEGPTTVEAYGLTKNGNVYTNAAYGSSDVTLRINIEPGIGRISLEVEETQE